MTTQHITRHGQRRGPRGRRRAAPPARPPPPRRLRADRHPRRLRHEQLRRLHRPRRRRERQVVHDARGPGGRPRDHDHRGHGRRRHAPPAPAGVLGPARPAVRLLHAGHDHAGGLAARAEPGPHRGGDPRGDQRQPVPLHRLREHRQGDPAGRGRAARAESAPSWPPRPSKDRKSRPNRPRPAEGERRHDHRSRSPARPPRSGAWATRSSARRTRASSGARASTSRTSTCRASCGSTSSAARTPTPGSSRSTRPRR